MPRADRTAGGAPLVSVIIPAYDARDLIGEAVDSVLRQTHGHLELIVVDDCSPVTCRAIVEATGDPRVRFIRHDTNQGAQAARKTGVQASRGEIVFFLDQDDLLHPQKLERHVEFLEAHPEIGFTYNPHFTVLHPRGWTVGIWRPPADVTLQDLVEGFPIPPSVWVMRREWALREELYDESARLRGAETVICGRLLLAGCRFGMVDRALNYRHTHLGRRFANPVAKCREERLCQERLLADPRCPPGVDECRARAAAGNYLVWANVAFAQHEPDTGHALLDEALQLNPALAEGEPSALADFVVFHALLDATDPEAQVETLFSEIGRRLPGLGDERPWALGTLHFLRAAQHLVWERSPEAMPHVLRLRELGWRPGHQAFERISYELLCYELEFGWRAADAALQRLDAGLAGVEDWSRQPLESSYPLARAFDAHARGLRDQVPGHVLRAFARYPRSAANRGAWSILLGSLRHAPRTSRAERS